MNFDGFCVRDPDFFPPTSALLASVFDMKYIHIWSFRAETVMAEANILIGIERCDVLITG